MSQQTGSTCSVSTATSHCRQHFLPPLFSLLAVVFDVILLACLLTGDKEWLGSQTQLS